MSTVNTNVVSYGIINEQGFKQVHAKIGGTIHQGDLCYLDSSTHTAKALDTDTHAATLLGVALQPSSVSSNVDNGSAPAEAGLMVGWDVVANLKTTATENYVNGTVVYVGADAQTITTVSGSNRVGIVLLPVTISSVTGAANVTVPVVVKSAVY
jgi:hypothetical protein